MKLTGVLQQHKHTRESWGLGVLLADKGQDGMPGGTHIITVVGPTLGLASVGEQLDLEGELVEHPKFGPQFQITQQVSLGVQTEEGAWRWLERLDGVGPAKAKAIMEKLGEQTLAVLNGGTLPTLPATKRPWLDCKVEGCGHGPMCECGHCGPLSKARQKGVTWEDQGSLGADYCPECVKAFGEAGLCVGGKCLAKCAGHRDPLQGVPGIGPNLADRIRASWSELGASGDVDTLRWLDNLGLSRWEVGKVISFAACKKVTPRELLAEDPYSLTEAKGLGFLRVDAIALRSGIPRFAPARSDAAVLHWLAESVEASGHTVCTYGECVGGVAMLTKLDTASASAAIGRLTAADKLVVTQDEEGKRWLHPAELLAAEREIYRAVRASTNPPKSPQGAGDNADAFEIRRDGGEQIPREAVDRGAPVAQGDRGGGRREEEGDGDGGISREPGVVRPGAERTAQPLRGEAQDLRGPAPGDGVLAGPDGDHGGRAGGSSGRLADQRARVAPPPSLQADDSVPPPVGEGSSLEQQLASLGPETVEDW